MSDEQMDLNCQNDDDATVIVQTHSINNQRSEAHLTDNHNVEIM